MRTVFPGKKALWYAKISERTMYVFIETYFRAVLGSQENWLESTEFPYIPPVSPTLLKREMGNIWNI